MSVFLCTYHNVCLSVCLLLVSLSLAVSVYSAKNNYAVAGREQINNLSSAEASQNNNNNNKNDKQATVFKTKNADKFGSLV